MSVFLVGAAPMPPPSPPANGAQELVAAGWDAAQTYARDAFDAAQSFIDSLSTATAGLVDIPNVDVNLSPIAAAIREYVAPTPPVEPDGFSVNVPAAPSDPTLTSVAALDVGAAPEFTDVPLPISMPVAPTTLTVNAPVAPTLVDVATPDAPDIVLPEVPTMLGVNIPGVPLLNMPSFDAVLAVAPLSPANSFSFTEPTYTSALLTSLRARLQEWVDGANTGIAPVVEQAIWDRERAREVTASARKLQEVLRGFATRGFSKPPGALATAMLEAVQDSQNKDVTVSRDIMIKQADLEQSNRRYAFDTAFKVEAELITYQNQIAQRAFDVAKYTQQVAIDIFVAEVQRYGAEVQAYGVQSQVFKTRIEAELAKLDVYKSELEGQKLIGELNVQMVEIYKARITAAMSLIDIFKARIEAANLSIQGQKLRIDGFAAQVNAYDSTVRAKAAEYQGYATMVQAEVSKIELFKAQAEAFRSRVEGFRATVDAAVAEKTSEIEINQRLPLELFKSRTEVFRTLVDSESARVGALAKIFETRAQVFDSEVKGETADVAAGVAVYKAQADVVVAEGGLRIEAAKANIQKLMQQITILVESVRAGAQVSAQLAASALSAVNLSGQVGDSVSYSAQISASNSYATNMNEQVGDMTYHNLSTP